MNRSEGTANIAAKLVYAAANLTDEEVCGLAELVNDAPIRRASADVAGWFTRICQYEQTRRGGDDVEFPEPPAWSRWSDGEAAGALEAMIHATNSAAVASGRVRDLTDLVLGLVAGIAMTRLRIRQAAASN